MPDELLQILIAQHNKIREEISGIKARNKEKIFDSPVVFLNLKKPFWNI